MHRGGSWLLRPLWWAGGAPFGARDAFTSVLALAITLALGRTGRLRVDLAEARAQTAEEAARRRSTEERLRIARELHDIIGHSLGTIAVQAGVGRHLMANEPERPPKHWTASRGSPELAGRGARGGRCSARGRA